MDTLIQEIIAKDLEARKRVKEIETKKTCVKQEVEAKREQIFQEKRKEMEDRLASLKAQQAKELAEAKKIKTLAYETASLKLKEEFAKSEDEWVKELVECCLHS